MLLHRTLCLLVICLGTATAVDNWQGIGGGGDDRIWCLLHDESAEKLYVAGDFNNVGAVSSYHAAVWGGSSWSALGAAFTATPLAIARSAVGDIYLAAGTVGDAATTRVYRLSGSSWVAHGNGAFAGPVKGLAIDGDTVYATGYFTTVGGRPANHIAKCIAGGDWDAVGTGLNGEGHGVSVRPGGGAIAVGGAFTQAGGATANRVALWDGANWSAIGAGTNDRVRAVQWTGTSMAPILHVAGDFTQAAGIAATGVARYDGTWTAVGTRSTGTAYCLYVRSDASLVVGHASGVDAWGGTTWATRPLTGSVTGVWYDADGDIYACGAFSVAGGSLFNRVARWDATPPSATLSVPLDIAYEGGANGQFRVTIANTEPADLIVGVSYTGTASTGDYTTPAAFITVAAGTTSTNIPIAAINDTVAEVDESVIATINAFGSGYGIGAPDSATAWIRDDDTGSQPEVTVSVPTPNAGEGTGNGTIRINLSAPVAGAPLTIDYQVSGTATNGTDYATLSGSVTLGIGASAANLSIQPVNDAFVEGAETVTVTVVSGANYQLGNPIYGTVIIADDETAGVTPTVTLSAPDTTSTEGLSDTGTFRLTVSPPQASPLTVHFTRGGTATHGTDYATIGTTATIPAGAAIYDIVIAPIDDALTESTETVTLTLAVDAAYTVGNTDTLTVNIIDDESTTPVATFVATDASTTEGADTGTFVITLSPAPAVPLTVTFGIFGDALPSTDYTHDGTFSWAAGQSTKTITITALTDALTEADEEVRFVVTAGTGYTVGAPSSASILIHNTVPGSGGGGGTPSSGGGGGGGGGCGAGGLAGLLLSVACCLGLRRRNRP